jgi:hypothetical protein
MIFDPASSNVAAFKKNYTNIGIGMWQSEYQTKLELANAAKEAVGYEFYMDVTGDIVFKPPFYNLDVLGNKPMSWIQDIDIIDWDFSESESEVVTQIAMQGSYSGTEEAGVPVECQPFTSVTDYHLLRKYGWRTQNYNSEFLSDPTQMFYHGLDVLDRINSRRHRGTVTIPMRAELRMGFPIYIAPKDQIWYISGISHTIQFGGRATTTLQLTGKRSKFISPRGIGDLKLLSVGDVPEPDKNGLPRSFRFSSRQLQNGVFRLDIGNALTMPADQSVFEGKSGADNPAEPLILRHPKTGRIVGYPNVVMAYTRPFSPSDISSQAGQIPVGLANPSISKQQQALAQQRHEAYNFQQQDRFTASRNDVLQGKYLNNTYQYGLNSAGVFVYAHDSSAYGGVISEVLTLDIANLRVTGASTSTSGLVDSDQNKLANPTALIRPVSDERGFEVIGHFQYGRRVALRDGRLIINSPDAVARIDLQLALSGDVSSMLTAQSQGLTTVSTGYLDPAGTLAKMTADDQETAAIMVGSESNPNVKTPEFVNVGDLFVTNAPIGSEEQKGTQPSVEVSQLSRALTLAEMAVQDAQTRQDEDCVCLTGRADLAFMSSDYQVKVLTGNSAQDNSTLGIQSSAADLNIRGGPIDSGATQAAVGNVARIEAEIVVVSARVDELRTEALNSGGDPAIQQMLTETQSTLDQLTAKQVEAQSALNDQRTQYGGSGSILTKTNSEVVSRVDRFLVNLYTTLDDAHQQFESALRGDLLRKQNADFSNLNAAATNPPSEFAPPFSAPNRFMLGDPNASIGSIQTNTNNVAKAWSNFGQDLKSSSESRSLSTQVSQDKASIARLTATRDQLIKQQKSSGSVIGIDLQKQIDTISTQISTLQQQLANNQAKLNAIK